MKIRVILFFIFIICGFLNWLNVSAQSVSDKLVWQTPQVMQLTEKTSQTFLRFDGAIYYPEQNHLPFYFKKLKTESGTNNTKTKLENQVFETLTETEFDVIQTSGAQINYDIVINETIAYEKKQPFLLVSFIPIRKNPATERYEKLVSFDLKITAYNASHGQSKNLSAKTSNAPNSVLSTGNWYKINVTQDGIHKITQSFLKSLGMDVSTVNPSDIRIYGNGGGMLPVVNSNFRYDDLTENAIYVEGESDGVFNNNDYILFYGEGPNRWTFNTSDQRFHHQLNLYSGTTSYFITSDLGPGKRVSTQSSVITPSNYTITGFDDFAFYEKESVNLIKSGREWYGEEFNIITSYSFNFSFPNIDVATPVYLNANVIARASNTGSSTYFRVTANGQEQMTLPISDVSGNYTAPFGYPASGTSAFQPAGSQISVAVSYDSKGYEATGWLNYIELNARRRLDMAGDQMLFRDMQSVNPGNYSEFVLSNANAALKVWEVTNPLNAASQEYVLTGSDARFILATDSLRTFIAFSGLSFLTPQAAGKVENQNLHGISLNSAKQPEMIIVSHPLFVTEAKRLADFHAANDNLSVEVITPQQIYDEFSSGSQDITAIRDFMKMLYDRAESNTSWLPKYLLLFGDGSYDNRSMSTANGNFIPTYQSQNSYNPLNSFVADEYYGLLDDNEGNVSNDLVDIGIGRLPVKSSSEAKTAVDKIIRYSGNQTYGDWRNSICFVADDGDGVTHINDADKLATQIDGTYNTFNIEKIYIDSYKQESSSGGQRYPSANDDINKKVERGALIVNYTGHGGEVGWAHERILEVTDINSWNNYDRMPLFVTATCEFSRFDDPGRVSAGELVFLNNNGGGIALMSTTRLVFSFQNFQLNQNFYNVAFKEFNGEMPRLGDLYMLTKVASGTSLNNRNFSLLGDPAMKLAYPKHEVITTEINNSPLTGSPDTIKALSKVTITGEIRDKSGQKLSNFNGVLYPTVYDKPVTITTLANDPESNPYNFKLQKNILFKGKASVTNGLFSFTFIVPKDINYNYDYGKISYYGDNGQEDAAGYYRNIIIGGSDTTGLTDNEGPEIILYLNDENFVFGGLTDESPNLLAYITDSSGINTVGNGIGHDVVAILDENTSSPFVLNDYYEADLNRYQNGKIQYPFKDLSEGAHRLRLKVWDVNNNSSEAYTEFIVAKSAELALDHVFNYPNPFTTKTEFWFEHNRPGQWLDVQIQIFTVSGKIIKTINTILMTNGYRSPSPIAWNGTDDFGDRIGRGVYLYHLKVKAVDGSFSEKYEKLVVLN